MATAIATAAAVAAAQTATAPRCQVDAGQRAPAAPAAAVLAPFQHDQHLHLHLSSNLPLPTIFPSKPCRALPHLPSAPAGLEFDDLSPPQQAEAVGGLAVFARVEPTHKTRLVELLKAQVRLGLDCTAGMLYC